MYKFLSLFFLLFCTVAINAQISGTIFTETGEPLPYATIYIETSSYGTVTNVDGEYELVIEKPGIYQLVYQYVGYEKMIKTIHYDGKPQKVDIILKIDQKLIHELVISADREDPAYEIMRKAIKNRGYYKDLIKTSEADLYVKGTVKITDVPKKILGEEVGNLGGILDSARQGLVYLSESKSKFYFKAPDRTKEVMISSIKSGENDLFTANQFNMASFDIYSEYLKFGRSIVSPLADHSFNYYDFELEKTTIDGDGRGVNKIKVTPRSLSEPLLKGYIYINDDLWNVNSVDLQFSGRALRSTFLDTVFLKQVFIPIRKPDVWNLFSQVINFKAGIFGFKMGGTFTYIFSNFELDKNLDDIFINHETFRVEKDALKKDSSYWETIRPVPLTVEEENDYIKKDSLAKIWNSKTFMDSLDHKNNKLGFTDFFFGYTWRNTFKNIMYSYPVPLSTVRFNAVEGFKLNLDSYWTWSDSTFRTVTIQPILQYGFTDKIFKPSIRINYLFDNRSLGSIYIHAGRLNLQFDPRQPITERNTSWSSLWNKINGSKVYQSNFIKVGYKQEVSNGVYFHIETGYENRIRQYVNTQYSYRFKNKSYDDNIPRTDYDPNVYNDNKYWNTKIGFVFRPLQKYSSYPNLKIRDGSNWPNIEVQYEMGVPWDKSSIPFQKLVTKIRDSYVDAKLFGYFNFNIELGFKLSKNISYFGDFFHPIGNEILTPIDPDLSSFNLMPYYSFSSDRYYFQFNYRHHFNGYIMDKIPLLKKTSLKAVSGISALYEPKNGSYLETLIGIENFRIGPIVLFAVDYTWSFDDRGYRDQGFTIRLSSVFK